MRPYVFVIIIMLTFSFCREKESATVDPSRVETAFLDLDSTQRPLFHKFTSTGCGGCARFGIPVFEEVANRMKDSILPLMTHFKYDDPFINESSKAIEKGIGTHQGSPQIWINQDEVTLSIIRMPVSEAADWCENSLKKLLGESSRAHIGLDVKQNERGRFTIKLGVKNASKEAQEWMVEVYGHEDSIWASQSGTWPPPYHDFVNRGGYYGKTGKSLMLREGELWFDEIEYIPCANCQIKNMYFVLVVWEYSEQGNLRYVNGKLFRP